jgi:hypothetical protein
MGSQRICIIDCNWEKLIKNLGRPFRLGLAIGQKDDFLKKSNFSSVMGLYRLATL